MFVANLPVTDSEFFDRNVELRQLDAVIEKLRRGAPRWLCIVGNRRVGKSSLLLEAARRMREGPKSRRAVALVVVDVMESAPVSAEVFRTLALEVLDAVTAGDVSTSLRALARKPSAYVAALTETRVYRALDAGWREVLVQLPGLRTSDSDFARTCLELPEVLAKASGVRLLVAIDEFQEIASLSLPAAEPMALMRTLWQRHRHTGYVVSGSSRSMLMELATSHASPFFQHFEVMQLAPFSRQNSIDLLTRASADSRPISPALASRVYEAVGGHPFYLQVVGEELASLGRVADERALRQALQDVLFSRTGSLALYFEREYQRAVGRATTLASVLDQLAAGPLKLADIARAISATTGPTLGYLNRLGDVVLRQEDGRWALADPTFGLWVRWRQPGGSVVPMSVIGDEAELAVATQLARMGFNTVYQSRASRGAFDLLAMRGSAHLALQVRRRRLPLSFSSAEWHRMQADGKALGWSWVVAAVDEGAVRFLDPAKAKRASLDTRAEIKNLLAWL